MVAQDQLAGHGLASKGEREGRGLVGRHGQRGYRHMGPRIWEPACLALLEDEDELAGLAYATKACMMHQSPSSGVSKHAYVYMISKDASRER